MWPGCHSSGASPVMEARFKTTHPLQPVNINKPGISRLNVALSVLITLLAMQLYSPVSSNVTLHKFNIAVTTGTLPATSSNMVMLVLSLFVKVRSLRVKMKSIGFPVAEHETVMDSNKPMVI